ncbi:phage tail tape measure protein [Pectobacterium parvum]|uniref:Phage tail tape measure protein n=1 Tax=Pectobacterium parvum TaxID=2778550 RepID=A0AAP9LEG6_9GAMM|nr:phage tail tape measure protein [Pectobacterium parvum]QHQ26382.1 phage tail tape measure protein [Pectobacterium parvum]
MTDRNLNIRVAFSAINNMARPVSAARSGTAALADQIRATQNTLNGLGRQASSFDRLSAASAKTTRELEQAKAKAAAMRAEFGAASARTDEQNAALKRQRELIRQLSTAQTNETEQLKQLRAELARHGVILDRSRRATDQISDQTARYNRMLAEQQRRLAAVTQARARYDRMQQTAGNLRSTGAMAIGASAAGAYVGARMMAPNLQSDKSGAVIAAQNAEAPAMGSQYSKIIKGINSAGVSNDLAQIASTVSAVRSSLGTLGEVGEAELDRISRKALYMQSVLGGETAEHIQIAAIMMKNGLARSSDEAFDLMAAGMQRVSTQMRGELPEILHEYSTHFRNMGYSGSEAMTLLVSMAQQGKFALDKTGDAIKEFSIRGSDMSKASVEAYDAIGLNAQRASSAIASGGAQARNAMQQTAQGLLKIKDPAARANAAIALFGTPIEDLSIDQIPNFLSALANTTDQFSNVSGTAERMGSTLRDNLSGDIDQLAGALSGLRFDIFENDSGILRTLAQSATGLVNSVREWVTANPELAQTLLVVVGSALALTAAIGTVSLATGILMGPFSKLQLGLSLLTGGRGIGVATGMFGRFRNMMTSSLSGLRTWGGILTSIRSGISGIGGIAQSAGRGLLMVFTQPGAALSALGNGVRMLATSGFSALSGSGMAVFNILRTGFMLLLSPIGIIGAAIVAAGVLIYKYWEPISAFFSGFFSGLTAGLEPVKQSFSALSPIFDGIGQAISGVWDWFKKLFEPVNASSESLKQCTEAGKVFGEVVGMAISGVVTVILKVAEGIGWILEKLGVIPEAANAAVSASNAMNGAIPQKGYESKKPVMYVWDKKQKKMVAQEWKPQPPNEADAVIKTGESAKPPAGESNKPKQTGALQDLTGSNPTTAKTVSTAKTDEKKDPNKLGDIVFKNVPPAVMLANGYRESQVMPAQPKVPLLERVKQTAGVLAASVLPFTVQPAGADVPAIHSPAAQMKTAMSAGMASTDKYEINITIQDARSLDEEKLVARLRREIDDIERRKQRRQRSQLTDHV